MMTQDHPHPTRSLVTGGAGFIGSHLCDRLIAMGHEVTCLDNLTTGDRANIDHLFGHSHFLFLQQDVTGPIDLEVDEIYNLACPASPVHYQNDPVQTIRTSVHGAINLLDLAQRLGCRILQASTSEVYGDPLEHPQQETYWGNVNPVGIRSCYDEGKRCAETLFFDYHRQHGVDIKIARIFNTYGPRMQPDDGRVVSNFIVQALRGEDITMHGTGTQSRTFCYVDDLVTGLIDLMKTPTGVTGPVNLGSDTECAMIELARQVQKLTGTASGLIFTDRPGDDPCRRQPNLNKARGVLNWQPKTAFHDGLAATIAYFRERGVLVHRNR